MDLLQISDSIMNLLSRDPKLQFFSNARTYYASKPTRVNDICLNLLSNISLHF